MARSSRFVSTAFLATVVAFLMIAFQAAGKAARDGFFLSNFSISRLPSMVAAAAVVSLVVIVLASWLMARMSASRFVPPAFLVSGLLAFGEWALQYSEPRVAAVLVYLHIAVFGPVLASGFWALVSESFDPHMARESMARIGAGGTAGGLVGGLVTVSFGLSAAVGAVLPLLGLLHLACARLTLAIGQPGSQVHPPQKAPATGIGSVFETIRWTPHLQGVAGLALLSAASAAFLDFVFKAEAGKKYLDPGDLVAFFACFYTATALLTFLCQIGLANVSIEKLGLGKTAGSLPVTVASGQLLLIALPGLYMAALARGAELALRSSLFRSAYELFFTPLRDADRRRTKLLIDVGAERLGDAIGGGLLIILIGFNGHSQNLVLLTGAALATVAGYLAFRLQRSYVSTLAARVMSGAVRIPVTESAGGRLTLFQSLLEIPTSVLPPLRNQGAPDDRPWAKPPDPVETPPRDLLESEDEEQVRRALGRPQLLHPDSTPTLIRLLAWDAVAPLAASVLIGFGPDARPSLAAGLADPSQDFVIRRRIPAVLAHDPCQSNVDALLGAAADRRFEVRYRAAAALRQIQKLNPEARLDRDRLIQWIVRELSVDRLIWRSRFLLDGSREDQAEKQEPYPESHGAGRSLRHVFNLLTLILPADPLTAALIALRSGDARLQGTSLEYLKSVVPPNVWEKLEPLLQEAMAEPDNPGAPA